MYKPVLHNVVCLPRLSRYPEKMAKDPKRVWQGVKGECIIMFIKMMKMMLLMVMMMLMMMIMSVVDVDDVDDDDDDDEDDDEC